MKKKLIIVLTFLFALLLIGCKENGPTPSGDDFSWAGKEAAKVKVVKEKLLEEYDLDEFELSMLYVEVEFADGSTHEFSCGDSHFALSKEVKTVGKPRLQIICTDDSGNEIETANFTITFVSYTAQDAKAIEDAANAIMVKRNGDKVEFVVAKSANIASGQLQFTYDASKLTFGEATKGSAVGYVHTEVKDGKVSLGFTNDAALAEGTVICSIAYTGDYRNSGLALNEEFENACWMIADNTPAPLNDVVYHVSRK